VQRSFRAQGALLAAVLLALSLCAQAQEFALERASTRLQDGVYLLDAQIDYRLSDTAAEALDNGVPLTTEVHLQVRREDAWIWQSDAAEYRLRYVIRYHALSGLYEVAALETETRRNFVSREAALSALGEIDDFPLIERDSLEPDAAYRVALKAELDIEALPLPLRPVAYLSGAWKLSSEWTSWRLEP
jgi:hypothetical protein